MAKKKTYILKATVDKDTYEAFKNGEAVSNNGLRSTKGNFWSNQPEFSIDDRRDVKEYMQAEAVAIASGLFFTIVLPNLKRFTDEKIYPLISEKWDAWRERKKKKQELNEKTTQKTEDRDPGSNLIRFDDYQKQKQDIANGIVNDTDYKIKKGVNE